MKNPTEIPQPKPHKYQDWELDKKKYIYRNKESNQKTLFKILGLSIGKSNNQNTKSSLVLKEVAFNPKTITDLISKKYGQPKKDYLLNRKISYKVIIDLKTPNLVKTQE